MAYSTLNPPALLVAQTGSAFGNIWIYRSTDAMTVVRVDGYVTDAKELGMQVGDLVICQDIDDAETPTVLNEGTLAWVKAINANGSADLSDGTAVSVTDTD